MLQALLVTFREGIEAFLIVGIVVAYLKKTQRAGLVRGVRIGLAISVDHLSGRRMVVVAGPQSAALRGHRGADRRGDRRGAAGPDAARRPAHQAATSKRASDTMAGVEGAPASPQAIAGVALVTALLVTREGLEAVFYLGVQALALHAAQERDAGGAWCCGRGARARHRAARSPGAGRAGVVA